MSTDTHIAIVPRQRMADFFTRYGGFTSKAEEEVVGLDRDGDGEILKRRPRADGVIRDDGRDRIRAFRALHFTYQRFEVGDDIRPFLAAISFYWPVAGICSRPFNDAGGKDPICGPILKPERCKHLLDCWFSVDAAKFQQDLDKSPSLWDSSSGDYTWFQSGKSVWEYLDSYAGFLDEAIKRDSFYTLAAY